MSKKIEVDTKTFVRFWLVILGLGALGWFLMRAATGLLLVAVAIFLAIALKPLANRIDEIDKSKKRESLSSVLAVVVIVLSITVVIGFVGPVVIGETARFVGQVPEEISKVLNGPGVDQFGQALGIDDLRNQILASTRNLSAGLIENLSSVALGSVNTIAQILTMAILVIVLTILFMLQGPALMEEFWRMLSGKNKRATEVSRRIVTRMTEVISKYVSKQLLIAVLDGLVVATIVLVLSLIFGFSSGLAVPMGLLAMVLYLVPMFGPIIACILVTAILTLNSLAAGLIFGLIYIIYAQIENNVIAPNIQGKSLSLPPLLILVAITIGMYAFGLIGTIVAVPIAGCLKVLLEEYPKIRDLSE
ncbi:MAG: AI-2E family transporter [Candidatus Saccharibacteria bacterium]|nr:AI-2E family transporter [Candidatus Saccharibacteria bacterium]